VLLLALAFSSGALAAYLALRYVQHGVPVLGMVRDPRKVDSLTDRMPWTVFAYNAPSIVYVGESHQVALMLTPKGSAGAARRKLTDATGDTAATVEADSMRYGSRVVARLEGDGFAISPPPSEARPTAVGSKVGAFWVWEITPTRRGTLRLALSISPIIMVDGKETELPKRILVQPIEARERWWKVTFAFIDRHFEAISGLVSASVLALAYVFVRTRKSRRMGFGRG
jgi:hypothetical protein